MRTFLLALTLFLLTTTGVYAAVDTTHIGFVNSSIWFDREPFFSGQSVRVYTTLANSTSADFKGVVEFYDGTEKIGSSDVSLERNGGFQTVWTDWTPREGTHAVSVRITNATVTESGGTPRKVSYGTTEARSLSRFVDTDTDGDGIGNKEDTDDDGDGIPDVNDAEPLVAYVVPKDVSDDVSTSTPKIKELAGEAALQVAAFASSTSPKIKDAITAAVASVEDFRVIQKKNVDNHIETVKEKIAKNNTSQDTAVTDSDTKKNAPFDQIQLLALTAAGYTLSNTLVFYLAGAILLYLIGIKLIPWIYRRIWNKDSVV